VFVNRRVVKDRTIAHAIIDAYSVASIKERSPEVHLFIEMPRDEVDVNVHPTKAEVRFREQSHVHEVVRRTLGEALGRASAPDLELRPPVAGERVPLAQVLPGAFSGIFPSRWTGGAGAGSAAARPVPFAPASRAPVESAVPSAPEATAGFGPLMLLGQFRDTFIIAVDDEGVAIIDQHVAHERVLFERITERLTTGRLESQRLLEPMLLELPPGARQALVARSADLDRLGFDVEEFGGAALRVSAVPALLRREDCNAALRALAEDLEGLDRGAGVEEALKRIAATTACHAAVKANDPLTPEKMRHILEELYRTAYSTICPHGRPVMLRLTRREIERNFQRI
jgi:DNA mismatch repair protein MutL